MAQKIAQIDFIKTFVKNAEVMMKKLEIEEAADLRFWKISKTVSELYSALKLAAGELNHDYGFQLNIPEETPNEVFSRAEAFYHLHSDILSESENNPKFNDAEYLFNPSKKSFEKRLDLVRQEVSVDGNEFDRYWLNRNLVLTSALSATMVDELYSKMKNEFLVVQLAEQMVSTLVQRGASVDASNVDGVRSVLSDAAEEFAKSPEFISEKEIVKSMLKRFQAECSWDGRNKTVQDTVADYMEEFTGIVAKNRPEFYRYDNNQDASSDALSEFDNVMPDETYAYLHRSRCRDEKLGIYQSNFKIPAYHDLNKIFIEADALLDVEEEALKFKPGSKEEFWNEYCSAENVSEELDADIQQMIGQMLLIADKDLYDVEMVLQDLEDVSIQNDFDEDDEEHDSEVFGFKNNDYYAEAADDIENKKLILHFARDILNLDKVIKHYYDIEMNETPIDAKVIKSFKPEEAWDDFTFSSLNMLFNDFDSHLNKNQGILLPHENTPAIRPTAIDEIIALPSSLEKRNILKLFQQGLMKIEFEQVNDKLDWEQDMVDDFTIFHESDKEALMADLLLTQELLPEIDDDKLGLLAKDINAAAVVNYVVPLYDDREPDEDARIKLLEGIMNYEDLSIDARGFVKKVAERHVERILKTHNEFLDGGDFDRDLYTNIEEYNRKQTNIDNLCESGLKISEEFKKEEKIYSDYCKFKKTHPQQNPSMMNVMWFNRICNN